MNTPVQTPNPLPEILFHLRWIGKIALSIGVTATLGLVIMLKLLTASAGMSYAEIIQAGSLTEQYLGPALLIGGFFLLAFTALLTWLITLYSSFRITGPLFRFGRNLEASIATGPVKPIPIRRDDRLHREAELLDASLGALRHHYDELRDEVDRVRQAFDAGELDPRGMREATGHLRDIAGKVHV